MNNEQQKRKEAEGAVRLSHEKLNKVYGGAGAGNKENPNITPPGEQGGVRRPRKRP